MRYPLRRRATPPCGGDTPGVATPAVNCRVTINGSPVYYYGRDQQPGQISGQSVTNRGQRPCGHHRGAVHQPV